MKDNTRKTLKYYWQFAKKYKLSGFLFVMGVMVASIFGVITPIFMKKFFDVLTSGINPELLGGELLDILIIIAVIEITSWLGWRIATFAVTHFQSNVMADLGNFCFAYLHKHSYTFFNNNFVGSLVKKVGYFVRSFEGISDRLVFDLMPLIVNIVFIVIIMSLRSIVLGIILIIWIVIFLFFNYYFSKFKLKYDVERSETESETSAFLADTITSHLNVKLFNGYKKENKGYAKLNRKLQKIRNYSWDLGNVVEAFQGFLMILLEVGIFYFAISLWLQGVLTVGDFVLIQAYLINIFMRIWNFGRVIVRTYENLADAEEMTEILNTPHEIKDVNNATSLQINKGEIEFKDVDFYYHKTRPVLKKFNLTIKPGEKVALIGPSGAGKSTVVKLLLRMHDITGGKILIDGQKVSRVTQESLWENISLVPQDPILFHRTLKENISYGKVKATEKEIIAAAKAAHSHEFIKEFPEGYKTYVGERGVKLSGGERQRVAIARAILHNTPILVLDEATSSLDSESEMLIQGALENLMAEKTVIVIAHRLSTIRQVDRIIVIDNGGIIEQGTHDELTTKPDGVYKKLWELQAGGFI